MFPQLIMGADMKFLMKFESILKSCIRIGVRNSIALITSISVVSESDSQLCGHIIMVNTCFLLRGFEVKYMLIGCCHFCVSPQYVESRAIVATHITMAIIKQISRFSEQQYFHFRIVPVVIQTRGLLHCPTQWFQYFVQVNALIIRYIIPRSFSSTLYSILQSQQST